MEIIMGYFKEEQIEEIEMQLQDPFSFSTYKEFYLMSEAPSALELLQEEGFVALPAPKDEWTLSLFDRQRSA